MRPTHASGLWRSGMGLRPVAHRTIRIGGHAMAAKSLRRRRILNRPDGTLAVGFADSVAAQHPPIVPTPPFSGPSPQTTAALIADPPPLGYRPGGALSTPRENTMEEARAGCTSPSSISSAHKPTTLTGGISSYNVLRIRMRDHQEKPQRSGKGEPLWINGVMPGCLSCL